MLRFYDTATGVVEDVLPRDTGSFTMYVCGPTVDRPPHVGHGRSTLVYDVLRRFLEWRGLSVRHVSNITDIDDKIIARAAEETRDWRDVVAEGETNWFAAMDALGVLRPHVVPHATEYVAEMLELIDALVASGHAYETSDGVYLHSATVPGYGLLAHQPLESLRAGARIDVVEDKRSEFDFALWKRAKPGEPSWPSPYGEGRPGWHTECVAMSLGLLGEDFDLHGGGLDLVFPHHENERAQAVALGRRFARHWVHHGLVTMGGEKMSKSLGNVLSLAELTATSDPRAYRLLVLRSRYRSPLEVSEETLADAANGLERLDALARRFAAVPAGSSGPPTGELALRVRAALEDDLDTPLALSQLFEALRRANALADRGDVPGAAALAGEVLELCSMLGLTRAAAGLPASVADRLARMDEARTARDFTVADSLRAELEAEGWHVENAPGGSRAHR